MPRRFAISADIVAPPLTFGETARKYGVPKAEVERVRTFLTPTPAGRQLARGSPKSSGARSSAAKSGTRRSPSSRGRR